MERPTGSGDSADDRGIAARRPTPTPGMLVQGFGQVARRVSFWTAVVLPAVALGLLVALPSWWLPALLAVFAIDVLALYVGHCHARDC